MTTFDDVTANVDRDVMHPWEAQPFDPGLDTPAPVVEGDDAIGPLRRATKSPYAGSPVRAGSYIMFRIYKETFSRVDGNRCRLVPSCSRFALRATRRYGPLGVLMAFARLQRNHNNTKLLLPARKRPFLKDPVDAYTFWAHTPRIDDFASFDNPAYAWYMHVRAVKRLEIDPP